MSNIQENTAAFSHCFQDIGVFTQSGASDRSLKATAELKRLCITMYLSFVLLALLAAASPPGGKLFHSDKSPSGAMLAEHFIFEPRDPRWEAPLRQIWLRDTQGKNVPILLFEHYRDAEVRFSPDEKWIAINDNRLSDEADVRLFRQRDGLNYHEIEKAQAGKRCWALLDRTSKRPVSDKFDHRYINAVRWAPDSRAVLLIAQGYLSGDSLHVDDWRCVFDVERLEASTDMGLMNRGAVPERRKP